MNAEALQRRAMVGLLPFCVAALSGRPPRAGSGRLPLREPAALTAEVVAAIQDMAPKAVYRWLFAQIGWTERETVDPADPEAITRGRLWDPAIWGDRHLLFTEATIDALLLAWNLTAPTDDDEVLQHVPRPKGRTWTRMDAEARRLWMVQARHSVTLKLRQQDGAHITRLPDAALGDLLLVHVLSRTHLQPRTSQAEGGWWTHNPLTRLSAFDMARLDAPREGLERLWQPDVRGLLPWICAEWPEIWRERRSQRPPTRERLLHTWQAQAALWDAWVDLAVQAERLDLLAPLIVGYRDLIRDHAAEQAIADRLSQGQRIQERQDLQAVWAESWGPLQRLEQLLREARSLHPIDREAHHRLFLATAAAHELPHLAAQGADIARQLRATIG